MSMDRWGNEIDKG